MLRENTFKLFLDSLKWHLSDDNHYKFIEYGWV